MDKLYDLTNPQKSIWNTEKFFEDTTINNVCGYSVIQEKINEKVLKKAILNIVKKNDSFRIQIKVNDGKPVQVISKFKPFNIDSIYLKNEQELLKEAQKIARKKIDILSESLFECKVVIFENQSGAMILNVNHIIGDSWSMGLFVQKTMEEYHALLNGTELTSESSYIEYVKSEEEYKRNKRYMTDKEYWEKKYEILPEIITIPSSKKNNGCITSCDANRESFSLNAEVVQKINDFCAQNKISVFNFLMAIYSIYLSRSSNLEDFCIGTPILNRTNFKEKHTTGMFVNTIPIRISINDKIPFKELSKGISSDMMANLKHQKYSYTELLENLREDDNKISNLYNFVISYQITKTAGEYSLEWVFNGTVGNDIQVHILDLNDTGKLFINYDYLVDKYNLSDIKDMHERALYIINQVLEDQDILVHDIQIITPKEKKLILNDFNNNVLEYPKDKSIVDLFEEQTRNTPNNVAVVYNNTSLTYKSLNEKANQFANYLKKQGVSNGDIIPVIMNRNINLIIAMLAIIKIGAVYFPISVDTPLERIKFIVKNSNSKYIITNLYNLEGLEKIDIDNINYDTLSNSNIKAKIEPSNPLYIIYTSGSTGKPKGVEVCHRNLANFIFSFKNIYGNISSNDRLLASTNISFDVSIFEFFIALLSGSMLYLYEEDFISDIYEYCNVIEKEEITFAYIPPNILDMVYNILSSKDRIALNKLLLGVEPIKTDVVKKFYLLNPNIKILNAYGPTETTICATGILLNDEILNNYSIIPIGKPLNNMNVYILDKYMQPVPIGVIGEIYVSGDGVSNGYLQNKELTEKSFIEVHGISDRAYKTGDLAKWDENGIINFVGRNDNQVKINGHRIELSEIEKCVSLFPDIKNAVVILDENKKINCYFSAIKKIDISALKEFIRFKLPLYFMPNFFIEVDEFKVTSNGKIDRKKLPKPESRIERKNIVLPQNNIDFRLVEILKELLKISVISMDDNFFDLGGDSLSAITLCIKIQDEFNVQIFVREIFDNPILKDISRAILNKNSFIKKTVIEKIIENEEYVVSSAQKRIYFASQIAGPNSILYNISGGVIFEGLVDADLLENCFNILIDRQESLRTYFEFNNEKLVQKVLKNVNYKLEIEDDAAFEDIDLIFKGFVKPFDLSSGPLFRTKFIKFTNGNSVLFIDMHHIIADGMSLNILAEELCKLYNGKALPELSITYKDYAYFDKNRIESDEMKEAEKYWLNKFQEDVPILNLPTVYPRPAVRDFDGKKEYFEINEVDTKRIYELSKNMKITPYMFLLACYYVLLAKYTSQDDIIIGSPVVGRDITQTYSLIGMFINTLAIRNRVDSSETFKDFLLNIKTNMLQDYKYQTYPFDELVNKLNIKRDTSRSPLFDVMFIYQNNWLEEIKFKDICAEYYLPDTNISKFDISLEAIPNNKTIKCSIEYATKLFDKEFILKMSEHYLNIINDTLSNIDTLIADINILSEDEKKNILYNFNDTDLEYPSDKTVIELFEKQVELSPNETAVVFGNQQLSYKELNGKANELAYYLRKNLKIKKNDLVGILVNRSLEMIVAILAVLKAGGAYVPIDPTYPEDRIEYMLNDSNSKILLTQNSIAYKLDYKNKICIDLDSKVIYKNDNISNLPYVNTPEDLCYVIYTSGSTGKPKGVMLKHKNIVNFIYGTMNKLNLPNDSIVASITTISFDIFVLESLMPLLNGLKVVIANEDEQTNVSLFNKMCLKNDVTVIQTTPSRMQTFMTNNVDLDFIRKSKSILVGGEIFPDNLLTMLKKISNAQIYNMYGPTETAVWSTIEELTDTIDITIGKPIANTQIYILDKNLKPTPIGIVGEIYISGDGVGKGYLGNKELTGKNYINNPFLSNKIMYKTGDLGKYRYDGKIICLGRADNQVKIRGLRIELGEIESLILKHPYIKKTAVIKQTINNREFISVYYVATRRIIINEVRTYLSKFLPRYMVPSYYIALEDLPYTPNGKIDKKQLPLPDEILGYSKKEYVEPETKLQKRLVTIWEKILNTKPIGIRDNFFELGGDSLLAMNLNIELLKISKDITYQDIFNYPTIAELEEKINLKKHKSLINKISNLSEKYEEILKKCVVKHKTKKYHPENVLLTGATGFLGIHILDQFLKRENCKIYCIVHEEHGMTARTKLYQKLNYYFGNKYNDLIDNRIFAISGDITKPGFGLNQEELLKIAGDIEVVINSAANVSHYGNYNDFYNTNVKSVKYLIDFCKSFKKKLYQVSTMSVSGRKLDNNSLLKDRKNKVIYNESCFYVGQDLDNVYVYSKFEAENLMLEAVNEGLDGYILRMGNLMPRMKDGVFQENFQDNAFINKIFSFIKLGMIPDYILDEKIEITPVDNASNTIYKIITHYNNQNRIFHLYNHKYVLIKKLVKVLKKAKYKIDIVTEKLFVEKLNNIIQDETAKESIGGIINDLDNELHLDYKIDIEINSRFTTKYLFRMLFIWPRITNKYLKKFVSLLQRRN